MRAHKRHGAGLQAPTHAAPWPVPMGAHTIARVVMRLARRGGTDHRCGHRVLQVLAAPVQHVASMQRPQCPDQFCVSCVMFGIVQCSVRYCAPPFTANPLARYSLASGVHGSTCLAPAGIEVGEVGIRKLRGPTRCSAALPHTNS